MNRIRYAVIGSGFRAMFYVRIAKALPEQFELTGVLVRSEDKKRLLEKQYGVFATTSRDELLSARPDFVVSAVSRSDNARVCIELMKQGIPVLAETPAADSIEDMNEIWRLCTQCGARVQIAEQYFLYPTYEAKLRAAASGRLGRIQNASLSAVHDYHAISLLRRALGAGLSHAAITAKKYEWPVAVTQNRLGVFQRGETASQSRVRAEFVFGNGTVGFYDFSGIQYHSFIRSRHFSIQGERGELSDDRVYYLDSDGNPIVETLSPACDGIHPGIQSIAFAGECVYRNPFPTNLLPEDETAIARLLIGMKEYIDTGREVYPLAGALQDAYLSALLIRAARTGETVNSEDQPWHV